MPPSFVCAICREEHKGLITDWAYTLPDEVWAIPESQRAQRARFNTDLCQFGERYFIRCILPVPYPEADTEFGWGAWAEVAWPVFEGYLKLYDKDGSAEPAHSGTLANELRPYPGSLGAAVGIQFGDPTKRPKLSLRTGDDSLLAREQRSGIDSGRYHEVLTILRRKE